MKNLFHHSLLLLALSLLAQSCVKDSLQSTYTYFMPVYKSKAEVRQSIKSAPPQLLQKTGKLFLYGHYIFINELNKGIHVIDNSNPHSPVNISFIAIPGNIDLAVKGNALYADLFTDLITIDITNPAAIALQKINERVFPERDYVYGSSSDTSRYIVDWVKMETQLKSKLDSEKALGGSEVFMSPQMNYSAAAAGVVKGVSGSMARFTIVNNYLYTVGQSILSAFNIMAPMNPLMANSEPLGWNIETIYPLKDKLFIGSQTGMFIYNIADPAKPVFMSSFSHACFNDPVIADERYAYITLRARTDVSSCWGETALQRNELDIVDISNLQQSSLVKIYDMAEPKGLSKDGNHLFICDGKEGLKIFDAADVTNLRRLKVISDINPFDVICQDGHAIVVAAEGIFQYDYSDINNIQLVSKISTAQ